MMDEHTPGPWTYEQQRTANGSPGAWVLMASGNRLVINGRSKRAVANRAVLASAPALASELAALRAEVEELRRHAALGDAS